MAKLAGNNAVIILDDGSGNPQTISTDIKSYSVEYKSAPQDVTGMGEPVNYIPGAIVTGVTLNPFYNAAATVGAWTVIRPLVGSATSKTLSVKPEAGGLSFAGEFMCDGYVLTADSSGKPLEMGGVHFSPMGTILAAWS
jgi:hypothetical protein